MTLNLKRRQSKEGPPVFSSSHQDASSSLSRNSNSSTKHADIISNSTLISSGSPAVYQLRPKKEKFDFWTRLTLGEKNVNRTNRTILLVGETGSGKSTLINSLFNYSMGVKFEDEVWFQIIEEEEKRRQAESQTSDVMVYEIFEGETLPYSLTIIDTSGYGDARGKDQDDITREKLLDLFQSDDRVHEVHAVGLVMKASECRLNDRLSYVFNSVMSLFGNNLVKNIVPLITHSHGRKPLNALEALEAANMKYSRDEKNQPVYFMFNNCQHEDRTEDRQDLEHDAKISERGMKQFTDFLEEAEAQNMMKTVEVLKERIRLETCIQNLQDRIKLTEQKQTEIRQITEELKKHEEEMKKNENFTIEVDEAYIDKETIGGRKWRFMSYKGAVCCTLCEENCHYPCKRAKSPKHCKKMKDGRCTVCTNKCPVSDHVKEMRIYVDKIRKVQKTEAGMKEKYESNKRGKEGKKRLLENLEEELKELREGKFQLLDESYQHVARLEQIALKVDSLSTHVHLDFLIEKMKEKGETEKVQKLEEMKRSEDEATRAAVTYMSKLI